MWQPVCTAALVIVEPSHGPRTTLPSIYTSVSSLRLLPLLRTLGTKPTYIPERGSHLASAPSQEHTCFHPTRAAASTADASQTRPRSSRCPPPPAAPNAPQPRRGPPGPRPRPSSQETRARQPATRGSDTPDPHDVGRDRARAKRARGDAAQCAREPAACLPSPAAPLHSPAAACRPECPPTSQATPRTPTATTPRETRALRRQTARANAPARAAPFTRTTTISI
ncbi:hypothetical protein DAEQUDRAFT_726608 [Daedalea quercina L-15889]|uniref:Uncharacterized protein n=1 Tax=Daedalea quercina L-15889 TaxID=1314783 RepID=A0A165QEE6_9APHY|nr:hypothetical protein DAEQUDRAFT_726608 [Daedalea quercina L-15889]